MSETSSHHVSEALKSRVDLLLDLLGACRDLTATLDLDQTLTRVLEVTDRLIGSERASIWLLDPLTSELQFMIILGDEAQQCPQLRSLRMRLGEGVVGWVAQQGRPLLIPDVAQDPRWSHRADAISGFQTRSLLCCPLQIQDQVIGVVQLVNKLDHGPFTTDDLYILNHLSSQIAIAIENARLYAAVEQSNTALRDKVHQLGQEMTERKRAEAERMLLERQLRQTQKMEALGVLAGGIAHDFNNVLYVMQGYAKLALRGLPPDGRQRGCLEEILAAGRRGANLVQQILTFSRKNEQEKRLLRLSKTVQETVKFLRDLSPPAIRFEAQTDLSQDLALADPTQIHQVVMNLCANAWQAMAGKGGVLRLTLDRVDLPEAPASDIAMPALPPGPYVVLTVRDTGHGMDEATQERIFEPFFTTKGADGGSGMGLAIVHGIVTSHGGAVTVESAPDQGAQFRVYFPLRAPVGESATQAPLPGAIDPRGDERILLVDDDPLVLNMARQSLEELGYMIRACQDSLDACQMLRLDPQAFDCVIADQTMPKMTGMELARAARLSCETLDVPPVPFIICSGYTRKFYAQDDADRYIDRFIKKPVEIEDLARVMREVLDRRQTNAP